MRLNPANWQQNRLSYTAKAEQITIDGLADADAVGYVRTYDSGNAAYYVFYGKQSRPAVHYSAKTREIAEKQVRQYLERAKASAAVLAEQKAAKRAAPKQAYHVRERKGIEVRSYNTAQTAVLIREALKKAFPGTKFSVRSDNFSGGSAIDVTYTDGPATKAVEAVVDKFEIGSFDGMTDSYNYFEDPILVDEKGAYYADYGAKYLHVRREYSAPYGAHCHDFDLRTPPPIFAQIEAYHERSRRQYAPESVGMYWYRETGNVMLSQAYYPEQLTAFAQGLQAQGVEIEHEYEDGRYHLAIFLKDLVDLVAA